MANDKDEPQDADMPTRIERLYDKPQEQWDVDDWRELAFHLSDELQRSTDRISGMLNVIDEVISCVKRGSLHEKLLRLLEGSMQAGRLKMTFKPPPKRPGRPLKFNLERAYLYFELARRNGTISKAARLITARKHPSLGRHSDAFKGHVKTEQNKFAKAIKMVRDHQAGRSLGLWMGQAGRGPEVSTQLGLNSVLEAEQKNIPSRKS